MYRIIRFSGLTLLRLSEYRNSCLCLTFLLYHCIVTSYVANLVFVRTYFCMLLIVPLTLDEGHTKCLQVNKLYYNECSLECNIRDTSISDVSPRIFQTQEQRQRNIKLYNKLFSIPSNIRSPEMFCVLGNQLVASVTGKTGMLWTSVASSWLDTKYVRDAYKPLLSATGIFQNALDLWLR